MSISSKEKGGMFNEINITPLTDIFLVLLIIMMVVAPTFQSMDKNIKMPEINSGINVDKTKATVSVTKDNHFYLQSKEVKADNLTSELTAILPELKEKNVVVKADGEVKNSEIMKIMKAAQEAGYEKLTVAGEPLSKKQQEKLEEQK
jgi:biopolymer transport protein ExbD